MCILNGSYGACEYVIYFSRRRYNRCDVFDETRFTISQQTSHRGENEIFIIFYEPITFSHAEQIIARVKTDTILTVLMTWKNNKKTECA